MESFYGGRQGASFVIKAAFKYITDQKHRDNNTYIDPYYGQVYDEYQKVAAGLSNPPQGLEYYDYEQKQTVTVEDAATFLEYIKHETMTIQFDRTDYKDVWYGEYAIIDPKNKNNKNNGKVYRRTLKQSSTDNPRLVGGVAEYIGQIVGPAGPSLQVADITNVSSNEERFDNTKIGLDDTIYYRDKTGNYRQNKYDEDDLYVDNFGHNIKHIPGNDKLQYTDNKTYIQHGGYNWYNFRQNTSTEDISKLYIGFDIPYYVTDFVDGDNLPDIGKPEIIRQINTVADPFGEAPFYEKYKIHIPRGLRGGWFENIHSVAREEDTEQSPHKHYLPQSISYSEPSYRELEDSEKDYLAYPANNSVKDGVIRVKEDGFNFTETIVPLTTWPVGAKGWIATFCWRTPIKKQIDLDNEPTLTHRIDNVFLGLDRDIKNITFSDTGTLTFEYNSWDTNAAAQAPEDDTKPPSAGVRVNGESLGYLPQFETWIKQVDWIEKIEIDNIPSVDYAATDSKPSIEDDIENITTGDNLSITFNNDTMHPDTPNIDEWGTDEDTGNDIYTKNLRTIAGIQTFDDGTLRVYRSDGTINSFDERINWLDNVLINNDHLIIDTNNDNIENIDFNLRLITGINLANDGTLTIYRSDGQHNVFPKAIDYITSAFIVDKTITDDVTLSEDDPIKNKMGHLVIQYNNDSIATGKSIIESGKYNGWHDFGPVVNIQEGYYITGKGYTYEYDPTLVDDEGNPISLKDQVSQYFYEQMPNGDTDRAYTVLVTYPEEMSRDEEVLVYYYDTEEEKWMWLGTMQDVASIVLEITQEGQKENSIIVTTDHHQDDTANYQLGSLSTPWKKVS